MFFCVSYQLLEYLAFREYTFLRKLRGCELVALFPLNAIWAKPTSGWRMHPNCE